MEREERSRKFNLNHIDIFALCNRSNFSSAGGVIKAFGFLLKFSNSIKSKDSMARLLSIHFPIY